MIGLSPLTQVGWIISLSKVRFSVRKLQNCPHLPRDALFCDPIKVGCMSLLYSRGRRKDLSLISQILVETFPPVKLAPVYLKNEYQKNHLLCCPTCSPTKSRSPVSACSLRSDRSWGLSCWPSGHLHFRIFTFFSFASHKKQKSHEAYVLITSSS